MELEAVMEVEEKGKIFFNRKVVGLEDGVKSSNGPIVITALQTDGVSKNQIMCFVIFEWIC